MPSLQVKNMTPPPRELLDNKQSYCQTNTLPVIDDYEVKNTEEGVDRTNKFFQEMDDDNEIMNF